MSEVHIHWEKGVGQVIVDGIDLSEKVGADLTVHGRPGGHPPIVTVHLIPHLFDYEGPAEVKLSQGTREFLGRLGWTPPLPPDLEAAIEAGIADGSIFNDADG